MSEPRPFKGKMLSAGVLETLRKYDSSTVLKRPEDRVLCGVGQAVPKATLRLYRDSGD